MRRSGIGLMILVSPFPLRIFPERSVFHDLSNLCPTQMGVNHIPGNSRTNSKLLLQAGRQELIFGSVPVLIHQLPAGAVQVHQLSPELCKLKVFNPCFPIVGQGKMNSQCFSQPVAQMGAGGVRFG